MKKYFFNKWMKYFLLTLTVCMIIFYLIGDYYHSEKDIFTEGEIFFTSISLSGDFQTAATDEEARVIRRWLTTLSSDDQTLHPVMIFPQIVIRGENGSVGFIPGIKGTYVYPEIGSRWRRGHALQMYIAYSDDPELTEQVSEMHSKALKRMKEY